MTSLFKPGQLVTPNEWSATSDDEEIELCNMPGGGYFSTSLRNVGRLKVGNVALVIAVKGLDGRDVYVLGPSGSGWTQGALLKIVKQPQEK